MLPFKSQVCLYLKVISFCVHFFFIVGKLDVSSPLTKEDICVTVGINDISKITCPGDLSEDGLTVTWNHPFLL